MNDDLIMKNEELQITVEEQKIELEQLREQLETFEAGREEEQRRLGEVLEGGGTEDLVRTVSELKGALELSRSESARLRQLNEMNEKEAIDGRLKKEELAKLRKALAEKESQLEEMVDRVDEAAQSVELVEEMTERIFKKDDEIGKLKQELTSQLKEKEELDELLHEWEEIIEHSDKALQLKENDIEAEKARCQELRDQLAIASEQNQKYKERVAALYKQVSEHAQLESEGELRAPEDSPSPVSFELAREVSALREELILSRVRGC